MLLLLIVLLLADLFSVGALLLDGYLWLEWNEYRNTLNHDYAQRCLYGAIVLLLYAFFGRFLLRRLLSTKRTGEDEPRMLTPKKQELLKRPDGTLINIEYEGNENGQPLLLVHGLNANTKNWYYQVKYFEKSYRIILMDLPGLGKSTRPANKDFSMEKMAADIAAVIEHTGARNPILWGHSMGGMAILTLLAKNKDANRAVVKGVILEHTTFTNPVRTMIFSKVMTALQKPVLTPLCYLLILLSPLIWISRWMSYANGGSLIFTRWLTFAGTQTPRQLDFTTLLSTLSPPAITARGCLGMFRYDVTNHLPAIETPALLIAANKDRLTKPWASEYMQQHLPHAQLVQVAPGGHQALLEKHSEVNSAAERFIQSLTIQHK